MSKRFGNITTPRDLKEDGVDAGAIRLLMFQTHYRQQLDLTDEGLAAAQEASRRLGEFQNRLMEAKSEVGLAAPERRRPSGSTATWPRDSTMTSTPPARWPPCSRS